MFPPSLPQQYLSSSPLSHSLLHNGVRPGSSAVGGQAIKKRQTDMAGFANTAVRTGGAKLTDRNHYNVPLRMLLFPWDRASTHSTCPQMRACTHKNRLKFQMVRRDMKNINMSMYTYVGAHRKLGLLLLGLCRTKANERGQREMKKLN